MEQFDCFVGVLCSPEGPGLFAGAIGDVGDSIRFVNLSVDSSPYPEQATILC